MANRRRPHAEPGLIQRLRAWVTRAAAIGRADPGAAMMRTGMASQLRANERIWAGFRELELQMLAAGSLAEVFAVVTRLLPERFPAVTVATLAWHDPEYELTRLLERELGESPAGFVAFNSPGLGSEVPQDAPRLGRADDSCRRLLFPGRSPALIQSIAVVPLRLRGVVVGSLNQASRDPAHFNTEVATDLLEHLAAVAAICIDNAVNRARLERDVITDPLTGVSNRRFFARRLQEAVSQWQRQGGSLRSAKRTPSTQPHAVAKYKNGFAIVEREYPAIVSHLRLPSLIRERTRKDLDQAGCRFRDAIDQTDDRRAHTEYVGEKERDEVDEHLRGDIGKERSDRDHPYITRQALVRYLVHETILKMRCGKHGRIPCPRNINPSCQNS